MINFKQFVENETDLSHLLLGPGEDPRIGPEEAFPEKVQNGSVKYVSPHGSIRYLYFVDGIPVSALQIVTKGKTAQIANVYTLPEFRKMGFAKKLLKRAKHGFEEIKHSKDLSTLGAIWKSKVEP